MQLASLHHRLESCSVGISRGELVHSFMQNIGQQLQTVVQEVHLMNPVLQRRAALMKENDSEDRLPPSLAHSSWATSNGSGMHTDYRSDEASAVQLSKSWSGAMGALLGV